MIGAIIMRAAAIVRTENHSMSVTSLADYISLPRQTVSWRDQIPATAGLPPTPRDGNKT